MVVNKRTVDWPQPARKILWMWVTERAVQTVAHINSLPFWIICCHDFLQTITSLWIKKLWFQTCWTCFEEHVCGLITEESLQMYYRVSLTGEHRLTFHLTLQPAQLCSCLLQAWNSILPECVCALATLWRQISVPTVTLWGVIYHLKEKRYSIKF